MRNYLGTNLRRRDRAMLQGLLDVMHAPAKQQAAALALLARTRRTRPHCIARRPRAGWWASCRSVADQTPTLLTQPPRFVDDDTSGHTVTARAAASGAAV